MGEHNALKYATDLIRGIKRILGLDDHEDGTTRVSETLYPMVDVFRRPDHAYPRAERRWGGDFSQGAVLAELANVGISNPTGSNVLIVVEDFLVDAGGAAQSVQTRIGANITFDGTGTPNPRDSRIPIVGGVTAVRTQSFVHSDAAAIGFLLGQYRFPASNATAVIPINVVLHPGFFFAIENTTQNLALNATINGYERVAYPGELLDEL